MSNAVEGEFRSRPPWHSLSLIAFTRRGCLLARCLAAHLGEREPGAGGGHAGAAEGGVSVSVMGPARYADELGIEAYESLAAWTAERFSRDDALVYVGATGIAVRAIAPHVRDKFSDPAVVSVDEAGAFAVPLLSGHVGGANDLARAVAAVTGGQAVVSTATDVNGLFAVDEWAARNNLAIVERSVAKQVSAALLEGRAVGFFTDESLSWDVPAGVVPVASGETGAVPTREATRMLSRSGSSCRLTTRLPRSSAPFIWCHASSRLARDAAGGAIRPCSNRRWTTRCALRACRGTRWCAWRPST